MQKLNIIKDISVPKFRQIAKFIIMEIEKGTLKEGEQLKSITLFSKDYGISRDTVEKAYKALIKEGYINAVKGIGNFILGPKDNRIKILLAFNKMSSYKKIIYESFLSTVGKRAKVDLFIHHYDPYVLSEIIEENLGKYHYYVIMPHFFHDNGDEIYLPILKKIQDEELVILDKKPKNFNHSGISVYQDFSDDIYNVLTSNSQLLKNYNKIVVVFPTYSNHPLEIKEGVMKFCKDFNIAFSVINTTTEKSLKIGTAFIVLTESDLATLVKQVKKRNFILGREIGVLSFNETALKELLDITVVTTDFEEMGRSAAQLILDNNYQKIKNPFHFIERGSL